MQITRNQFSVLEAIVKSNGTLSQRDLKKMTSLSLGTINKTIKSLNSEGLIEGGIITSRGLESLEPYRVKRAIFLAAGFGSRMMPITLNTPKPLVRVHGVRIIDRLIEACLNTGIDEIYIVRGYLSEQFDQLLIKFPMIKFLENPAFKETNNISSSVVARNILSNSYIFEADLLLKNPSILKHYHYNSSFFAIKKEYSDDWCFTVKNNIIQSEKLGGKGDDNYQMVGISYWNEEDGKKLSDDIMSVYLSPGGKERYWEQVPLEYKKERYKIEINECKEEDIVEIDTFNELKDIDESYKL